MNFAERSKRDKIKLELSYHKARDCWKKYYRGKTYYLNFPTTRDGYQKALLAFNQIKAKTDTERSNFQIWNEAKQITQEFLCYYEKFGVPRKEEVIKKDLLRLLDTIEKILEQPELPENFNDVEFAPKSLALVFVEKDLGKNLLSPKWMWRERLNRLHKIPTDKESQVIEHWLDKYLDRVQKRGGKYIREKTADDREFKLRHFRSVIDQQDLITVIDESYLERYHDTLDSAINQRTGEPLSKASKQQYFKAVKMFVRWAASQPHCELKLPANIDSKEQGFREEKGTGRKREEKKAQLWDNSDVEKALNLPLPYSCYAILMLNCGFRNIDVSELRKTDLNLKTKRITIQRHKLNQQDSAPVISYPLWDITCQLIEKCISGRNSDRVFVNEAGSPVVGKFDTLSSWWRKNRKKHDLEGKRLDYLRKTGSTIISQIDRGLDEFYLGESLQTTARVHYSFRDGEPCKDLDYAIQELGARFGFCNSPVKTIQATDEMLQALHQAGFKI